MRCTVYSFFLTFLAVFAWIEEIFWSSQRLYWQKSSFFLFKCRSKLAINPRSEFGSYSVLSLVRTEMINWQMYSFSSTAGISSTFLSSFFVFKNLPINLTFCSVFWAVFLFVLALKINSSTEQTEANLPSDIFQSVQVLCNGCFKTFSSVRSSIIGEISSFA